MAAEELEALGALGDARPAQLGAPGGGAGRRGRRGRGAGAAARPPASARLLAGEPGRRARQVAERAIHDLERETRKLLGER